MLTPSSPSPRRRARETLRTSASTPALLKPMRLTSARYSGSRNIRGRWLPGCGRGVTVPTSTKPKPSASRASTWRPSLSNPAARPTGLGKRRPSTVVGNGRGAGPSTRRSPTACSASSEESPRPCARSASRANRKGRANPYMGSSEVELDALRQRQRVRPVDGVGLPAHIGPPRIRARFPATAGFLLAAEGAADLGAGGADVDVGDAAVRAGRREELLRGLDAVGE